MRDTLALLWYRLRRLIWRLRGKCINCGGDRLTSAAIYDDYPDPRQCRWCNKRQAHADTYTAAWEQQREGGRHAR